MSKYKQNMMEQMEAILKPLGHEDNVEPSFYEKYIEPNTADYLRHLALNANNIQFVEFYGDDREDEFDRIFGEDKWKTDNTYNWDEPYSCSMVVVTPKDYTENKIYSVAYAPHYGGDVRGNYGDFIVFTFADQYEFIEVMDEFFRENRYCFTLDGENFECWYSGGGEHYYLEKDHDFISDGFIPEPYTEEDFLVSVKKELAKS